MTTAIWPEQSGPELLAADLSGGMVNSQVKQAQYNFVGASEQLESAHRSVVQTVRSSFNNINASISSINAYKQAVVSAQSSLDAMEAGYSVGTRTIVDVLDATTTLYNAKQELANARYNYLINQLNIKSALGTLNEQDLLALFERHGYDLVLMEGFKESGWPKIEVVRKAVSEEPVSFEPLAIVGDVPGADFALDEPAALADWIAAQMPAL